MTSDSNPVQEKQDIETTQENKENNSNVNLKFRAVVRAFLANIFITLIKLLSWYFTKFI